MAILRFRVYWEDDDSVYRDIVLRHIQNFFDLHQSILKCFEFDNKHKATFYRSNDNWQRGREISLEKYDKDYKAEPLIMSEVTSIALRPMRSPKCPNSADPTGRAKNANAKVARDCNVAVAGSLPGKNSRGKTSTAAVA